LNISHQLNFFEPKLTHFQQFHSQTYTLGLDSIWIRTSNRSANQLISHPYSKKNQRVFLICLGDWWLKSVITVYSDLVIEKLVSLLFYDLLAPKVLLFLCVNE